MRRLISTVSLAIAAALVQSANADEISDLIDLLKSKDPRLCARAALDAGKLGPKGEPTIPALIPLLGNTAPGEDPFLIVYKPVRQFAADALRQFGAKALPAIVAAIHGDGNAKVREGAVIALSAFDDDFKDVLPALGEALDDSDEKVRAQALRGIANHVKSAGRMVERVSKLLRVDSSGQVRIDAAHLLPLLDPDGRSAIAELKRALSDSNASVRLVAARSLSSYGAKSNEAVAGLIDLLADKSDVPFAYSADSFGSREVRGEVAVILGELGAVAKVAGTPLAGLRDDASCPFETRVNAAVAVTRIIPKDTKAVAAFVALLDNGDLWDSDLLPVLEGLDQIRGQARAALPAIRRHLKRDDGSIRWEAVRGLAYAGGASAVPDLVGLLRSEDLDARTDAVRALGEIGPDAREAVPALLKFLDEFPEGQWTAIEALGLIGPAANAALPRLSEILKSADADLSEIASKAVKKIVGE